MEKLAQQIAAAQMLLALGKATYEEIRAFFASEGHDEQRLDEIMAECDVRIERRDRIQAAIDARKATGS